MNKKKNISAGAINNDSFENVSGGIALNYNMKWGKVADGSMSISQQ